MFVLILCPEVGVGSSPVEGSASVALTGLRLVSPTGLGSEPE